MILLKVPLDIPINKLSEQYLKYVDWNNVTDSDIKQLPVQSLKYVDTRVLMSTFGFQEVSQMKDEDILSVIARDIDKLKIKYSHTVDYRLQSFLHEFCTFDFVKKYYKQINAMCFMAGDENIKLAHALFCTYGLIEPNELIGKGYYSVDWDKLKSTKVPIDHRYKIMKSGGYIGYTSEYDLDLDDMVPLLTSAQLETMPFMEVPYNFDDHALEFIGSKTHKLLGSLKEVTWDQLLAMYYSDMITYKHIERAWHYFLRQGNFDCGVFERRLNDLMGNSSSFKVEDFV